jgi:hypothetical protein
MRSRIRGQYRIDEAGKVIAVREPSRSGIAYATPHIPFRMKRPVRKRRLQPTYKIRPLELFIVYMLTAILASLLSIAIQTMSKSAAREQALWFAERREYLKSDTAMYYRHRGVPWPATKPPGR